MLRILFPSLRPEGACVFAPEVSTPVHGEDVVGDQLPLSHVDRGPAVSTASDRQGSVFRCDAEVDRDGWLQPEDYGELLERGQLPNAG